MLGGAAGAGLRYEVGKLALARLGPGFPWGTLTVNLAGGLLIGLLAGFLFEAGAQQRPLWLFLARRPARRLHHLLRLQLRSVRNDRPRPAYRRRFALRGGLGVGSLLLLYAGFFLVRAAA